MSGIQRRVGEGGMKKGGWRSFGRKSNKKINGWNLFNTKLLLDRMICMKMTYKTVQVIRC